MKKNTLTLIISLLLVSPALTYAAGLTGLSELITAVHTILKLVLPITFGIAVIYFFWNLGQFILHSDDEKAREAGKQQMLWGVIAIFVILSIYGILTFIGDALGLKPQVPNGESGIIYTGGLDSGPCNADQDPINCGQ